MKGGDPLFLEPYLDCRRRGEASRELCGNRECRSRERTKAKGGLLPKLSL